MPRWPIVFAGLAGASAVAIGAYAAHGMAASHTPDDIARVETAVRYQIWHALALVGVAALSPRFARNSRIPAIASTSFCLGILLFCGSLYGMSFLGVRSLAHIAPVGGLSFMIGWVCLACAGISSLSASSRTEG